VTNGEPKIEFNYYGNIINDTNEDWINTNLALSTAQPSIAGKPPELTTKYIQYKHTPSTRGPKSSFTNPVYTQSVIYEAESLESEENPPKSLVTSTSFNVPRKSTILADNKPHKVTVMLLKLSAEYTYTILPKLSPHAYLKASIKNKNKDGVPLLPGPMNVFMDSNFVAKSEMAFISPNESLGIFLGIDSGIKFDYQPIKQLRDTQGLITKTNKLNIQFNTKITNNKSKNVKIELFDNLPKTHDSQIKVKLIAPEISENDSKIQLTPANNVFWKLSLAPGENTDVFFHYTIEYPIDAELENAF